MKDSTKLLLAYAGVGVAADKSLMGAPLLLTAPPGVYLLTDDGREIHAGDEVPPGCQFFRVVGPSAPGMAITVPREPIHGNA